MSLQVTPPPDNPAAYYISKVYKPWPHQEDFHLSGAKNRLQVGSYGSGKSRPLLWEGVFHAIEYPGSDSIILRKTIPDLKRTVIDKFLSDVPRELYESYNESDKIVYFRPDTGTGKQSKLRFGACEAERDIGKYLSTEYVYIGFEELGEFPFVIWDAMSGRNRCPIPGARACMAAATNPMGIGWSWIKRMWVDHLPAWGMDPAVFNPADYAYFHSTVDMNPIYAKDREYIARLEASPNRDRIRWGKLDAVSGQYFENWEPRRHVRLASDFMFQYWQPWWVGWDYGFGHYACILFFTKAILKPRFEGEKPKVVNVAVRELVMHRTTSEDQARALISSIPRDKEGGYQENIESIHFSWERFNPNDRDRSIADDVGDILQNAGLPRPTRGNTNRVAGWSKIYSLLDSDDFFVLNTCPTLAEAIPLLVRDNVDLEDVVKPTGLSLNDDVAEACRYGVAGTLLDPEDKPKGEKRKEEIAAIQDPMARHVQLYRDYNLEQARQRQPSGPGKIIPSWMRRLQ